ncbi:MAG TPA: SH3 domain-containing C40 family peptidase [Planctomycetota bacterium]|nr:SH3 domain-containing C40 family peptidase [Planctomycetota bacterium]
MPLSGRLGAAILALALPACPPASVPQRTVVSREPARGAGVVRNGVEDLHVEPDETSEVATQAVLGTAVELRESATSSTGRTFFRVRTPDRYEAWIAAAAVRPVGVGEPAYARGAGASQTVEVTSPLVHVYPHASYTRAAPLSTLTMGTRVESLEIVASPEHRFFRVRFPDDAIGYLGVEEGAEVDPIAPPSRGVPADWIALGRRLLETPYLWGGTTPLGFDCSGLTQFLFARHGVLLPRDAWQQAEDPRFENVRIADVAPGDLVFFGDGGKITHVGMWVGDGQVLEATTFGRPCTKITPFDSPALKPRFLAARRLRDVASTASTTR